MQATGAKGAMGLPGRKAVAHLDGCSICTRHDAAPPLGGLLLLRIKAHCAVGLDGTPQRACTRQWHGVDACDRPR